MFSAIEDYDEIGFTGLHRAARRGRLDLLEKRLEAGEHPDTQTMMEGMTAAMVAATRPDGAPLISRLGQAGADLDMSDLSGMSAVGYAVASLNEPALRALLAQGAQADASLEGTRWLPGTTPLILAVQLAGTPGGSGDVAKSIAGALVAHGADVNAVDAAGRQAVTYAAMTRDAGLLKWALSILSPTDRPDDMGMSAKSLVGLLEGEANDIGGVGAGLAESAMARVVQDKLAERAAQENAIQLADPLAVAEQPRPRRREMGL